jgi:hypothetical protein
VAINLLLGCLLLMNPRFKLWGQLSTGKCDNVSMYLSMMNQDLNLCDLLSSEKCEEPSSQVRLCPVVYVCGEKQDLKLRDLVESRNVTFHVPEVTKPRTV